MRLVVLFGSIAATLALLLALDWWVDPLADHYRSDVVARAFAHDPPCAVSTAVLGDRTWPAFKLDLLRRRDATTLVVGSSRIWKIGAHPGERGFANVGLPGMSVTSVPILFRRLHELEPRRRFTIYLGLEPFWFTTPDRSSNFARASLTDRLRLLGSGETLRATLHRIADRPAELVAPISRRRPTLESSPAGCVLDENDAARRGAANAWTMDGRFVYSYEIAGSAPGHKDFLGGDLSSMRGTALDAASLHDVTDALDFARTQHWRVVGFTPPFSHHTIVGLEHDAQAAQLLRVYRRGIPALLRERGFAYLDLLDARSVPCTDDEFLRHDGAHANSVCAARVRRALDAATTR
jgi:hypothetical protein